MFDHWLTRNFSGVWFERYADDALIHCRTREEAELVLNAVRDRLLECGLTLHPIKTKLVYCKDDNRRGEHENMTLMSRRLSENSLPYTATAPALL